MARDITGKRIGESMENPKAYNEDQEFITPLCKLAYKYGSDKCPNLKHTYTPLYYNLFKNIRFDIRKVLEIGIGSSSEMAWLNCPWYTTGASLRMWRDFFPNAQIYGMDILPEAIFSDERITTFCYDQSKPEQLKELISKIGNDLDIVIDDGSHLLEHQVLTTKTLLPLLPKSVMYFIEDVGRKEIVDQLSEYETSYMRASKIVRNDDRILVVKNG